jgi:uncharacterized protein
MDSKLKKLNAILKELQKVVIAYSGGLDSTFLLKAALDALGRENVLAVTARSETYPIHEYKEALAVAKQLGSKQLTVKTNELGIKNFKSNPVNRCYYCKKELFKKLDAIKDKHEMLYVLDGTNYDDLRDVRHGRRAAKELGVRSPLLEAKMTKSDIRKISKGLGLPTWDKPSFACLASRFPFNDEITIAGLRRIGAAEDYLNGLGFRQFRVRSHKGIARVEVLKDEFGKALKFHKILSGKLKRLGFVYVTLDLDGYRTGSMHEAA